MLKRVATSTAIVFAYNILGNGAQYINFYILALLLTPTHFGVYQYTFAWINIAVIFGKLGLDTLALRDWPAYIQEKRWALARGLRIYATRWTFVCATAIAGLLVLGLYLVGPNEVQDNLVYVFLMCISIPLLSANAIRAGFLRALEATGASSAVSSFLRPTLTLFALAPLMLWYDNKIGLFSPAIILVVTVIATFLVGKFILDHKIPSSYSKNQIIETSPRVWLTAALPMLFIGASFFIIRQSDILMIGGIIGVEDAGKYALTSRIVGVFAIFQTATFALGAPMISKLYVKSDFINLQKMATIITGLNFVASAPIIIAFYAYADLILEVFGAQFIEYNQIFRVLLLGQLANILVGVSSIALQMTGHHKQTLGFIAVAAVLNLIFNYILIKLLGPIGAAISSVMAIVFWLILQTAYCYKKLGIAPISFSRIQLRNLWN